MMEEKMLRLCFVVIATSVALASCGGLCPPTLPVDICEATCGPKAPCTSTTLCCPTACGGAMCVDPMTQQHFLTLVKKGRCPEYPRGVWICTHTCTDDSDCPSALKCCPNRCGVQACQRPDLDEDTPQPV